MYKIGKIHRTAPPGIEECKDTNFTDSPLYGACSYHGGLKYARKKRKETILPEITTPPVQKFDTTGWGIEQPETITPAIAPVLPEITTPPVQKFDATGWGAQEELKRLQRKKRELTNKAFKQFPGSPLQKKTIKEIQETNKEIKQLTAETLLPATELRPLKTLKPAFERRQKTRTAPILPETTTKPVTQPEEQQPEIITQNNAILKIPEFYKTRYNETYKVTVLKLQEKPMPTAKQAAGFDKINKAFYKAGKASVKYNIPYQVNSTAYDISIKNLGYYTPSANFFIVVANNEKILVAYVKADRVTKAKEQTETITPPVTTIAPAIIEERKEAVLQESPQPQPLKPSKNIVIAPAVLPEYDAQPIAPKPETITPPATTIAPAIIEERKEAVLQEAPQPETITLPSVKNEFIYNDNHKPIELTEQQKKAIQKEYLEPILSFSRKNKVMTTVSVYGWDKNFGNGRIENYAKEQLLLFSFQNGFFKTAGKEMYYENAKQLYNEILRFIINAESLPEDVFSDIEEFRRILTLKNLEVKFNAYDLRITAHLHMHHLITIKFSKYLYLSAGKKPLYSIEIQGEVHNLNASREQVLALLKAFEVEHRQVDAGLRKLFSIVHNTGYGETTDTFYFSDDETIQIFCFAPNGKVTCSRRFKLNKGFLGYADMRETKPNDFNRVHKSNLKDYIETKKLLDQILSSYKYRKIIVYDAITFAYFYGDRNINKSKIEYGQPRNSEPTEFITGINRRNLSGLILK